MLKELSVDLVQTQISAAQRKHVSQETIDEIHKLCEDPDYGEEFISVYIDHLNVLKDNPRLTPSAYLNAIKFFSLVEMGCSLFNAYIKVFPERFERRNQNNKATAKKMLTNEAYRYNQSMLVNDIRKISAVPVQLIHRHLLHEAILETADIMRNARHDGVRQKAAATLIQELKPTEEQQINVKVEDGSTSVIEELRKAAEKLAAQEFQSAQAGVPVKDLAESKIIDVTPDEVVTENSKASEDGLG